MTTTAVSMKFQQWVKQGCHCHAAASKSRRKTTNESVYVLQHNIVTYILWLQEVARSQAWESEEEPGGMEAVISWQGGGDVISEPETFYSFNWYFSEAFYLWLFLFFLLSWSFIKGPFSCPVEFPAFCILFIASPFIFVTHSSVISYKVVRLEAWSD